MGINQWHCYPDGAAEFLQCWAGAAWALAQCEPGGRVKTAQASSSLNVALKPRVVTCLNRQQCPRRTHLSEGIAGMDAMSLGGSSATQSTCPETHKVPFLALGKNLRSHGQGKWGLCPLASPPASLWGGWEAGGTRVSDGRRRGGAVLPYSLNTWYAIRVLKLSPKQICCIG